MLPWSASTCSEYKDMHKRASADQSARAVPQLEKLSGPAYVNIGGDEVRARNRAGPRFIRSSIGYHG